MRLDDNTELGVLKWITLLAKHRFDTDTKMRYKDIIDWLISKFDTDLSEYDLVIGYRADDSYFAYSTGFVSGDISLETLLRAMKIGTLGLQYVCISPFSFSIIKYVSSEQVVKSDEYNEFRKKALNEYHELKKKENRFQNTFITEIMKKYGE